MPSQKRELRNGARAQGGSSEFLDMSAVDLCSSMSLPVYLFCASMFCAGYGLTGSFYTIERALKVHFPGLESRLIEQGAQESLLGPTRTFDGGHQPLIVQLADDNPPGAAGLLVAFLLPSFLLALSAILHISGRSFFGLSPLRLGKLGCKWSLLGPYCALIVCVVVRSTKWHADIGEDAAYAVLSGLLAYISFQFLDLNSKWREPVIGFRVLSECTRGVRLACAVLAACVFVCALMSGAREACLEARVKAGTLEDGIRIGMKSLNRFDHFTSIEASRLPDADIVAAIANQESFRVARTAKADVSFLGLFNLRLDSIWAGLIIAILQSCAVVLPVLQALFGLCNLVMLPHGKEEGTPLVGGVHSGHSAMRLVVRDWAALEVFAVGIFIVPLLTSRSPVEVEPLGSSAMLFLVASLAAAAVDHLGDNLVA